MNTQTNGNGKGNKGSRGQAQSTGEDVFDQPLISTDLPNGQYPARLVGKTPLFSVPSRFDASGRADRFNFLFAVKNPTTGNVIVLQSQLLSPPSRQAGGAGINSKSNLYKMLKPFCEDTPMWDPKIDNVSSQGTINRIVAAQLAANVIVEKNDEGFAHVMQAVIAPAGTSFPTADECAEALRTYEANAEERERKGRGGRPLDDGDDGPPLDNEPARDTR